MVALAIALVCGELALRGSGQSEALALEGGRVMRINALSLPFMGIYMTGAYFLEGLKRPVPPMIITALANVVNFALNWTFIYGGFGLPPMGAEGSAWATTIMRGLLALAISLYIWMLRDHEKLAVRRKAPGGWSAWKTQRRIGYSGGASQAVESTAFSLLTLIAGLLGAVSLAAYSISFQMLGTCFMVAMGFGSATAVLVGHAWGRKDAKEAARAGWLGLRVDWVVVCCLAAILTLFRENVAAIFAADPALIGAAAPLIGWVAFVIIPDHTQAVMAHALRARGDTWVPVATHFISYFLVLAPLAWLLALHTGNGTEGIVQATLVASLVSAAFLMGRFHLLSRRPLA
jgi:MATE family multidrug resistance protein